MRILIAYDQSKTAQTACDLVAHLRLPRGTQLAVVTVLDGHAAEPGVTDLPVQPMEPSKRELQMLEHDLARVAASLRGPDRSCETRVLSGHAGSALVEEAERWNADLIVVGNRGHGVLESLLLGSTSAEVVDHASCPVLVARHPGVHRLVIGVDGSQEADRAVATLSAWSLPRGVPASVVGVVEPIRAWDFAAGGATPEVVEMRIEAHEGQRKQLATEVDEAVATLRRAGSIADGEVREGDPSDQLIRAAKAHGADLLVVGTRGLRGLGRLLLGSLPAASSCTRRARSSSCDRYASASRRKSWFGPSPLPEPKPYRSHTEACEQPGMPHRRRPLPLRLTDSPTGDLGGAAAPSRL